MLQGHRAEELGQGVKNFQRKAESGLGLNKWQGRRQERSLQADGTAFWCHVLNPHVAVREVLAGPCGWRMESWGRSDGGQGMGSH